MMQSLRRCDFGSTGSAPMGTTYMGYTTALQMLMCCLCVHRLLFQHCLLGWSRPVRHTNRLLTMPGSRPPTVPSWPPNWPLTDRPVPTWQLWQLPRPQLRLPTVVRPMTSQIASREFMILVNFWRARCRLQSAAGAIGQHRFQLPHAGGRNCPCRGRLLESRMPPPVVSCRSEHPPKGPKRPGGAVA